MADGFLVVSMFRHPLIILFLKYCKLLAITEISFFFLSFGLLKVCHCFAPNKHTSHWLFRELLYWSLDFLTLYLLLLHGLSFCVAVPDKKTLGNEARDVYFF